MFVKCLDALCLVKKRNGYIGFTKTYNSPGGGAEKPFLMDDLYGEHTPSI